MNCHEVRRHWNLYYDSEGDAELCFRINEHLDQCPDCAEWFHQQSRLEDLIEEKLRTSMSNRPTPDLWDNVLRRSGVKKPVFSSRRWLFLGGMLALSASLFVAVLIWGDNGVKPQGAPDLARITARYHEQFTQGQRSIEFASQSDLDVESYLHKRVNFPVRCPPRQDTGFLVQGAGTCRVDTSEAAYLVGQVEGKPVSIFILSGESLARFPHQHQALLREDTHRCKEGIYEMIMAEIDQSVVLVIGQTAPERLKEVLKAYGTYPHTHQAGGSPHFYSVSEFHSLPESRYTAQVL